MFTEAFCWLACAAAWALVPGATLDPDDWSMPSSDLPGRRGSANERNRRLRREVVGSPFHPLPFDEGWRTSTAVALAQQMYEDRDFGIMPVLADALQDAGCDSEDVLNHCRGGVTTVRGCWVVDLVLGKM